MSDHSDTELVVQQEGPVVQVTMNRPSALNALSLEMIRLFAAGLQQWQDDKKVGAVFVQGGGDKAFCSGGDVKSVYQTGMSYRRGEISDRIVSLFFAEEYQLNRQIFHFNKPTFSFMNGIVMGGGFGIGGPCRYRIVSENTCFAMPETAIGLFPDVGSMYYLNRAPGQSGAWLALTGQTIGPADMLYCGLASHYVPLARQKALQKKLATLFSESEQVSAVEIEDVLADFHHTPDDIFLEKKQDVIDFCFTGNEGEEIYETLAAHDDEWAWEQADILKSRSPASVKVTLEHLRTTQDMSFDDVTAQDFRLVQRFLQGHDFYEGVRAMLVDKDRQPVWNPSSLEEVSDAMVRDYFASGGLLLDEVDG